MFVEIIYGLLTNSLGLLTDGAHMFLDCSSILIGLYAAYLVDKPKISDSSFGYKSAEVFGTFVNSVFLLFISIYILLESTERILHPQDIKSNHLILVSFLGLLVNLIGIFTLHDFSKGKCSHNHNHNNNYNNISDIENNTSNNIIKDNSLNKSHANNVLHNHCKRSNDNTQYNSKSKIK